MLFQSSNSKYVTVTFSGPTKRKKEKLPRKRKRMSSEKELKVCLNKMRDQVFDIDAREIVRILLKLVSNLLIHPGDEKFRVVKPENKLISKMIAMYSNFLDYLILIGFQISPETSEIKYILDVKKETPLRVELGLKVLKEFAREIELPQKNIPAVDSYKSLDFKKNQNNSFDAYKSNTISTNPIAAKGDGNSLLEKKLANLRLERKEEMEKAGLPDRNIKVFPIMKNFNPRNFNKSNATTNENINSQEEGLSDKNIIMAAGVSLIKKNEQNKKFSTKAMRDMEKLKNKKIFTKLVLRIQLPNRWVIELLMSPLETFDDLRKLIIEEVFNKEVYDTIGEPLYFFMTPPKTVFYGEDEKTNFDELRLVPAALIYLGFGFVDAKGKVESNSTVAVPIEKLIREEIVVEVKPEDRIKIPKGKKVNVGNLMRSVKPKLNGSKKKTTSKKPKWFKL